MIYQCLARKGRLRCIGWPGHATEHRYGPQTLAPLDIGPGLEVRIYQDDGPAVLWWYIAGHEGRAGLGRLLRGLLAVLLPFRRIPPVQRAITTLWYAADCP